MNPLSLLTLPSESLRAAYQQQAVCSPQAERGERRMVLAVLALAACALLLAVVLR